MKAGDKILITNGTLTVRERGWIGLVGIVVEAPQGHENSGLPYTVKVDGFPIGQGVGHWCNGVPVTELIEELG